MIFLANCNTQSHDALNSSDHHAPSVVSSPSNTANSSQHGENISLNSCDMQLLSPDLASILYSFNDLFEHALFPANLIRSASSAGETVTRNSQEMHASVPKRAETFNGASSKESDAININADILKSRVYKNEKKSDHLHHHHHHHGHEMAKSHNIIHTDMSADSGYHSRLCVDQNHDIDPENCSCTAIRENADSQSNLSQKNGKIMQRKTHSDTNNNLAEQQKEATVAGETDESSDVFIQQQQQNGTSTAASMPKAHFESILKFILDDYMRIKCENETLRSQLETRNKSIDMLKTTMEECKVQFLRSFFFLPQIFEFEWVVFKRGNILTCTKMNSFSQKINKKYRLFYQINKKFTKEYFVNFLIYSVKYSILFHL